MTEPGTRVLGYARAAPGAEDPTGRATLEAAGAQRVFLERPANPANPQARPQWAACKADLRPGDTLLVMRLDHLAATATTAVELLADLQARGVHLRSLTEPAIDTTATTTVGDVAAVLAGLRTTTARERTRSGLARARTEGRVGGRPTVMDTARTQTAVQMRADGAPSRRSRRLWASGPPPWPGHWPAPRHVPSPTRPRPTRLSTPGES